MTPHDIGFRIVGDAKGLRVPTLWEPAFRGYAACDPRANVASEAYLSAFTFTEAYREHFDVSRSPKGFAGSTHARVVWWDVDREDLGQALQDARRLATCIIDQFEIAEELLQTFFSGSKGFHLGLPTALWQPEPSVDFHRFTRQFAEAVSEAAGVATDAGVYDRVRIFRAPNSRHPKTGLYKRSLTFHELVTMPLSSIRDAARAPESFPVTLEGDRSNLLADAWTGAVEAVNEAARTRQERQSNGAPKINRLTLDFLRNGADLGDRHRVLFSAAANLAEFGCSPELAHALLTEAGLDSGLKPSEVRRQIECGLQHRNP